MLDNTNSGCLYAFYGLGGKPIANDFELGAGDDFTTELSYEAHI